MTITEAPHRPDEEEISGAKKLELPSDEEYSDAMLQIARRAYEGGRYEGARKILLGLVVVRPNDARLYEALGLVYQAEGNAVAATLCFEEALEVDGDAPIANLNLGEIAWRKAKDAERARRHLERVVAKQTTGPVKRRAQLTLDALRP